MAHLEHHGRPMVKRDAALMSAEAHWCGDWYDCQDPRCQTTLLVPSPELIAWMEEQRGGRTIPPSR